ncbi:hypothetical protein PLESTF_000414200 [Pleodorina starrii]|nr:hypothetical protein PLESTF_000414200 [Pleodorina starrii]
MLPSSWAALHDCCPASAGGGGGGAGLLVPRGGAIRVDPAALALLGVRHILEVDSYMDDQGGANFEPGALVARVDEILRLRRGPALRPVQRPVRGLAVAEVVVVVVVVVVVEMGLGGRRRKLSRRRGVVSELRRRA